MKYERVHIESSDDGAVQRLTVPGLTWDRRTAEELVAVCESFVEDRAIRVVTLGARSSFCTGLETDLRPELIDPDPAAALSRLRPPVIAAIDGPCHSVGLEVALAADIRICSPSSSFALPDLEQGRLPCWGGTQRLSRAIRPSDASAMLLLGTTHGAIKASQLGLVHQVYHDLEASLDALVADLLGRGPLSLELAKEAVHRGAELPLRDGLRLEGDLNHQLAATEDRAEGLQAFFDKRPPDFSGR